MPLAGRMAGGSGVDVDGLAEIMGLIVVLDPAPGVGPMILVIGLPLFLVRFYCQSGGREARQHHQRQ